MAAIEVKDIKISFKLDSGISKTIQTLPYMNALNLFFYKMR